MLIGIDANEANVGSRVGSNVYAYEILKYLHSRASNEVQFQIYLKSHPKNDFPEPSQNWQYEVFGPKKLWTQFALPIKLFQQKLSRKNPKIFFTLGHYAPRFPPIPSVISIMDLAFLKFKDEFLPKDYRQLSSWTKYSAKNAAHIFTISQTSKQDIMDNYDIDEKKITVTYPGAIIDFIKKPHDKSFQSLSAFHGITKPYLLFLGTLQPRKNLLRLIKAYAELLKTEKFNQLNLVIVGKKGWLFNNIFKEVENLKLEKNIIFTDFVSDYEKVQLLKNAEVFILPSLYEGFGLPVLEAMMLGIPTIASHTSSLPEIGGDVITYINDPKSVEDIKSCLIKVLQLSQIEIQDLIRKQRQQVKKFSWENCCKKTYNSLLSVYENKKEK
jgi:glycosyltransferase involved in cell wall biosynthesis